MAEKNPLPGEYADAMTAQGVPADALTVVISRAEVELLAQALQTKLTALGVTDIAEEGTLVLAGTVEITPGFARGVRSMRPIAFDTSADLDLDTFPEMFDYTRAGRAAGAPRPLTAVASARSATGGPGPAQAPATPTAGGLTHAFSNGGGRTLVTRSSSELALDEFILAADVLQIQSGTDLVIASNVNYLTIIARDISIGAGVRVVWEPIDAPEHGTKAPGPDGRNFDPFVESPSSSFSSPSGGVGLPGHGGSIGLNGESAPTVEIWALTLDRLPEFELQGHVGGRGQTGAGGGDGGDGCKGAHSEAFVLCLSGPGYGGDGGDGGDGGRGGQGGVGGRGGTVKLLTTDAAHEAVLEAGVAINIAGGPGGPGGFGGQGGSGGRGGEAGDAALPCFAEAARAGSDGSDGTDGGLGTPGRQGAVGAFSAIVITEQEFIDKWTAPQIRSITPLSAAIGDTVTIEGGNFVAGASVAFDGVPAVTTFVASTILQAVVPAVTVGQVGVLVTIPGGAVSNPANVTVHPGIASITPSPAALGTTITISGDGFDSGSVVLFRGEELQPTTIAPDGSSLQVFLPAPDGPYEEPGGEETISVRGSDWTATAEAPLTIRHVLSTGFDVTRHAYGFTNNLGAINGVASLGTFEQTYGAVEVAAEFLLEPVMTGAWFAYYLSFFNGALPPGYSSGFSITAADQYWNGNQNLITDVATLGAVEPLLTVAQGRILSQELLDMLAWQANTPDRAELSLNEIEAVFEDQLRESPEARRRMASISQLMPAGSIASSGFAQRLSVSHGLLPIRIEYPAPDDGFYRRLVVYDNAPSVLGASAEAVVEYTGTPGNLSFNIFPIDVNGALMLTNPDARNSSTGFTLSHVPLSLCWDVDVSLPRDFVFLFVPGPVLPGPVRTTARPAPALVVEDAQKRRFGTDGRRGWDDLPGAAAAIGAPGLYLLPLERDLRFTIHGTEASSYTLGIVSRSLGTSLTLVDVPIAGGARDTVEIAESLRRVTVATGEAQKKLALHYGVEGVGLARAVAIEDLGIGRNAPLTLHADRDLGTFQLEGRGSAQQAAVSLSAAVGGEMRRREVGSIPIGGGLTRGFAVDWEPLELRALGETPGLPGRDPARSRRG